MQETDVGWLEFSKSLRVDNYHFLIIEVLATCLRTS